MSEEKGNPSKIVEDSHMDEETSNPYEDPDNPTTTSRLIFHDEPDNNQDTQEENEEEQRAKTPEAHYQRVTVYQDGTVLKDVEQTNLPNHQQETGHVPGCHESRASTYETDSSSSARQESDHETLAVNIGNSDESEHWGNG